MNLQRVFNKFGGVNNKVWHDDGQGGLLDANDKKLDLNKDWMWKALADKWQERNLKSAVVVSEVNPRTIKITLDEDDEQVKGYLILDQDMRVESNALFPEGQNFVTVAFAKNGTYNIHVYNSNGKITRIEEITIDVEE